MAVANATLEALIKGWREVAAPKRGGRDEGYADGLDEAADALETVVKERRMPIPVAVHDLPRVWRRRAKVDDEGYIAEALERAARELERALAEEAPAPSGISEPTAVAHGREEALEGVAPTGDLIATDECVIAIALSPTERFYWTGSESKWSPYLGAAQVMFASTVGAIDHSGAALAMPGAKLYRLALVEIEVKR